MTEIVIDMNKLSIGDIEDAEAIYGRPIMSELGGGRNNLSVGMVSALAQVVGKKTDPNFTREMARALSLSDITIVREGVSADPTLAAPTAVASTSEA